MMLARSRHQPFTTRKRLHLPELKDMPFILLDGGHLLNHVVEAACVANGFSLEEATNASSISRWRW